MTWTMSAQHINHNWKSISFVDNLGFEGSDRALWLHFRSRDAVPFELPLDL